MRQKSLKSILVLLAVFLPTAWAMAQDQTTYQIAIATMQNGTVVSSHKTAGQGETVTLTVKPDEYYLLRKGSLTVESTTSDDSDHPIYAPHRAPIVGDFVNLTKTTANTYTFTMPDNDVLVSATFIEEGPINVIVDHDSEAQNTVTVMIEPDYEEMTATINYMEQTNDQTPTTVYLPATVTDGAGNVFTVNRIAGYLFYEMTNITDIYLPTTDEPIVIEEGAFLLDDETGTGHHIARLHVPFHLLDDYALMTVLSENYQASKMMGIVSAAHRYHTVASGVDIQLAADIQAYTVFAASNSLVVLNMLDTNIIKANNGILIASPIDGSYTYEVTAIPSSDRPSGITPPTGNAKTYPNNQLVPVIERHHYYAARNYYVLHNNQFYPLLLEDEDKCCPAGKALLRITD